MYRLQLGYKELLTEGVAASASYWTQLPDTWSANSGYSAFDVYVNDTLIDGTEILKTADGWISFGFDFTNVKNIPTTYSSCVYKVEEFVSDYQPTSFSSGESLLYSKSYINLYKSKSDSSQVLINIPKGEKVVKCYDPYSSSGWIKIKYKNYTGYCHAKDADGNEPFQKEPVVDKKYYYEDFQGYACSNGKDFWGNLVTAKEKTVNGNTYLSIEDAKHGAPVVTFNYIYTDANGNTSYRDTEGNLVQYSARDMYESIFALATVATQNEGLHYDTYYDYCDRLLRKMIETAEIDVRFYTKDVDGSKIQWIYKGDDGEEQICSDAYKTMFVDIEVKIKCDLYTAAKLDSMQIGTLPMTTTDSFWQSAGYDGVPEDLPTPETSSSELDGGQETGVTGLFKGQNAYTKDVTLTWDGWFKKDSNGNYMIMASHTNENYTEAKSLWDMTKEDWLDFGAIIPSSSGDSLTKDEVSDIQYQMSEKYNMTSWQSTLFARLLPEIGRHYYDFTYSPKDVVDIFGSLNIRLSDTDATIAALCYGWGIDDTQIGFTDYLLKYDNYYVNNVTDYVSQLQPGYLLMKSSASTAADPNHIVIFAGKFKYGNDLEPKYYVIESTIRYDENGTEITGLQLSPFYDVCKNYHYIIYGHMTDTFGSNCMSQ